MANTRNHNANVENNMENNNAANLLLLPPPPTLGQVIAIQVQMLQTMQQTMINMHNAQPQAPPPLSRDRLGDFQCTKPPAFTHVVELMGTEDWLKYVKKKLQVVQCNNHEKVLLANYQLSGPTVD
jgi:hypothetical protein